MTYTQTYEYKYVAKEKPSITLKNVEIAKSKPKEIQSTASQYQGVQVTREALKSYLEATFTNNGLADQIKIAEAVLICESGFQIDPKHNGISWGIAQFTKPTWQLYGYGDIMNPQSQLTVLTKMWLEGKQNNWDCWCMSYGQEDLGCKLRGL